MDKYGYLVNPAKSQSASRKWLWLLGIGSVAGLIYWLANRKSSSVGKITGKKRAEVTSYTVTAPVDVYDYQGPGMPFDIDTYELAPLTHIEVDNNGVARLFTDDDERAGGLIAKGGQIYFVTEQELNSALYNTRLLNKDILLTVVPYGMIGTGYLGYCTSGAHIGQPVYITMMGQIGRILYKSDGGELTFVPLEVIDRTENIWAIYIKPGV